MYMSLILIISIILCIFIIDVIISISIRNRTDVCISIMQLLYMIICMFTLYVCILDILNIIRFVKKFDV